MSSYDYIIAIDFEATCWDDNIPIRQRVSEIIEFPAVLFNLKTGKIEAEFHEYLRPVERTILSNFCKKLTGISQNTVDNGKTLPIVLKMFEDWLSKVLNERSLVLPKTSKENLTGNVAIVTWSDFDLGTFLHNECKRKNLEKPAIFNRWIDIGIIYTRCYKTRARRFVDALQRAGVHADGRLHSGIDDARNLAALTYKMVQLGTALKITADFGGSSI